MEDDSNYYDSEHLSSHTEEPKISKLSEYVDALIQIFLPPFIIIKI